MPEITILLRVSGIRETGLAALKAGESLKGAELLREARGIVSEAALSREVLISAESFQHPAEAYFYYKRGEFSKAQASLLEAIALCHTLRDDYEHLVEVRRIHLARNVVRVMISAGKREQALRMAGQLVRYVTGDERQWPLRRLRMMSAPDPLVAEERWLLMDQILGEIALLVSRHCPASRQLVRGNVRRVFTGEPAIGEFAGVHAWLGARRASVEGDIDGFLNHGLAFFTAGRGYLSRAWRELSLDLLDLCRDMAPEELASIQSGRLDSSS